MVIPGDFRVGNLRPDPRTLLPVDAGLDLAYSFETELGLHALTGNANLRAGPSTEARVLAMLEGGTGIDVIGKTVGRPFYLVAIGGRVKGYVHEKPRRKRRARSLILPADPYGAQPFAATISRPSPFWRHGPLVGRRLRSRRRLAS